MSNPPPINEIRRANLIALTDQYPSRKEFARAVERDEAMLRRYRAGQPMGNEFARHIESMLHLPDGYMDHPHPAPTPGALLAKMEAFVGSNPPDEVVNAIAVLLEALTPQQRD